MWSNRIPIDRPFLFIGIITEAERDEIIQGLQLVKVSTAS